MLASVLQEVAYSLNILPNAGTRITPFHIMHGVDPFPNPKPCIEEEVQSDRTHVEWYEDASRDVELAIESAHTSLPTDEPRESFGGDKDEMTEESGARRLCPIVSCVDQTGLSPRISRYSRVIRKPLRFRETTDSEPV